MDNTACDAYFLNAVIEATTPPNETTADADCRSGVIVEMLKCFAPSDAVESMVACHCVMLQFVLTSAMTGAANVNRDLLLQTRMRSSAMSISKQLHQWVTKYESMKTCNEMRAAEAILKAETRQVPQPRPDPIPAKQLAPERPLPDASPKFNLFRPAPDLRSTPLRKTLLDTTQLSPAVRISDVANARPPLPSG